jgi:hypothetical protein
MLPTTSLTPTRARVSTPPSTDGALAAAGAPRTFADWVGLLRAAGFTVLPQSHAVPVDLWLREPSGRILHLRARGTRVVLRAYEDSDLTTVLLRAECDCAEHRAAGAAGRSVLTPGAVPSAEAVYDGAAEAGWSGVEAGLLTVGDASGILVLLLSRWEEEEATFSGAGASTGQPHSSFRERSRRCAPSSVLAPAQAG